MTTRPLPNQQIPRVHAAHSQPYDSALQALLHNTALIVERLDWLIERKAEERTNDKIL